MNIIISNDSIKNYIYVLLVYLFNYRIVSYVCIGLELNIDKYN